MAPKDKERLDGPGKGRGRGRGKGGRGAQAGVGSDTAKRLQELDGGSVEAESNFEILRAQRAQARKGVKQFKDIRENEGVDEDDPLNSIDDGIRLEPFNMRREMREGHFDESGFYVLNKDEEKKVTDAWLDTVDQAERTATFRAADKQNKALDTAANRLSAMAKNLGPDSEGEEEDIFERVTSFLEPRRPQHPAHAGWLCWQRVAAWYTSKGCMDVVHVVISGKCLLKIWLSDPEAFETARRMALMLPLDSKVSRSRFTLKPLIVHASFRLQPGSLATLLGDIDLVASRLEVVQCPKLRGFGENQWICEDLSMGDDDEDKDDGEGAEKKEAAEDPKKTAEEEAQEDEKDEATIIDMLEELVTFLEPLESPAMALARVRRGEARGKEPVLKTRARMRKARAEANQAVTLSSKDGDARPKRKKFNEWGYEEPSSMDAPVAAEAQTEQVPAASALDKAAPVGADTAAAEAVEQKPISDEDRGKVETELAKAEAARAAAAAAVAAERAAAAESAKAAAEKSSVTNAAAVAEAAAKAAADEKAAEEAAKAFAAEMKMSRSIARALVPEQGPEAAAIVNLNSEETRDVREKAMPKLPEEVPADGPPRPGHRRKAAPVDDEEAARRAKMSRLTDLCDRLLERGVLVYDSARELLAIDVRQRKGENLTGEEELAEPPKQAEATKGDKRPANDAAPEVQFTNKRFKAGASDAPAVETVEANSTSSAGPSSTSLLWQFRWGHNPDEINGPFDSVTMQGWMMQGCFSDERPAEFRQCDEKNQPKERCWHRWDKIDFELYM
ncbi:Cd2bp2 [Symbiodinium sp. CCMP2456]|nr:Cd2bp2 [Symbiodinium sp. CCMP2456]